MNIAQDNKAIRLPLAIAYFIGFILFTAFVIFPLGLLIPKDLELLFVIPGVVYLIIGIATGFAIYDG